LADAFGGVALALTSVVCDPTRVFANSHVNIHCEAPNVEDLLYEWVNALVYEMATRHMLFSRYRISIVGTHLAAEAWGEPLDVLRHEPAVEIKGATYTDLKVSETGGRWTAQCIVDV
jgi:SHS2 domain-containing protein